jgi:hypothetical protein
MSATAAILVSALVAVVLIAILALVMGGPGALRRQFPGGRGSGQWARWRRERRRGRV